MRPVLYTAAVLGACAVASVFRPANSQPPARLPDLPDLPAADAPANPHAVPYGVGKKDISHRTATSCSASSCHGGGAIGKVGSEHTTWAPEAFPREKDDPHAGSDPHAKAYRVLFNEVSVEMAKKLDLEDAKGNKKVAAHQAVQCLKCHAVDSAKDDATQDQILSEGVGCGACHGPADKWVGEHYTAKWKALTNRQKWDEYGFVPTKNIVARTLNCASCHVGDGDRDMNHDMIAAGHPRLAFEAATFHHQPGYRTHWTEKGDPRDFEVRLWVVGQAAALRAAVNLLYERARRAEANDPKTPWPEFSGHSCYACHQKLPSTEVRGTLSDVLPEKKRRPGVPGWEVWSNAAVEVAAGSCELAFPGLNSSELSGLKFPELDKLRALMGKSITPSPTTVKEQAGSALKELDAWLAALQVAEERATQGVAAGTPRVIAHRLAANALSAAPGGTRLADHDWDALAANYLGAAAMYSAAGTGGAKEWERPLLSLRGHLRFPDPDDGPGRYNSPFDRDLGKLLKIRDDFATLRSATAHPEGK